MFQLCSASENHGVCHCMLGSDKHGAVCATTVWAGLATILL